MEILGNFFQKIGINQIVEPLSFEQIDFTIGFGGSMFPNH